VETDCKKYIVWDWNGTLLNDIDISIEVMNIMLHKRGINKMDSERYLEIFGFPVREYYVTLGFNLESESFEELAVEFIDTYLGELEKASLFEDALPVLERLKKKGFCHLLLSAMEQNSLLRNVIYLQADKVFDDIVGSFDMEAYGKFDVASELKEDYDLTKENAILIGDTLHDKEIADQLELNCLLLSTGHQAKHRLEEAGVPIFDSLEEIEANLSKHL
jgi:phosphoglycolate phosphatase